jgi:hypothetical protein
LNRTNRLFSLPENGMVNLLALRPSSPARFYSSRSTLRPWHFVAFLSRAKGTPSYHFFNSFTIAKPVCVRLRFGGKRHPTLLAAGASGILAPRPAALSVRALPRIFLELLIETGKGFVLLGFLLSGGL